MIFNTYTITVLFLRKVTGNNQLDRGQLVITHLATLEASSIIQFQTKPVIIPEYKFYTNIINKLISNSRQYGCSLKNGTKTIRYAISKDLQFEKKIITEHAGGIAQFFIISAVSWSFFLAVKEIMSISILNSSLLLIISLQLGGVLLYIYLAKKIKTAIFQDNSTYLHSMYILKSLIGTGIPLKQVIELSRVSQFISTPKDRFKYINLRIVSMLERVQKTGTPVSEEISEIIEEIWFIHNMSFENFLKKTVILKFFIIAAFYLTSYFLFLIELFDNLL
jgi:hypothetical protein